MKIERVDDKTVKCFLSNEELEAYEIDYKDFVMRNEKAKELVQEIIEQAVEEVGYKPPRFAFDLQIMMVPEQGIVLTFSEKDPLENLDGKEGEQLVECLKEMKKILQKAKPQQANTKEQLDSNTEQIPKFKQPQTSIKRKEDPEIAIFKFDNLSKIIELARVLPANLRVRSTLFAMQGFYYLYMHKGAAAYERYSRACIQAMEFGSLDSAEPDRVDHLREHGECLIAEKALKKMRLEVRNQKCD